VPPSLPSPPFLHRIPLLAQPSQFVLACIPGSLVTCLAAWWHSSQQLYKIFKAQALLSLLTHMHTHMHMHAHTHTQTQPFYRSIDVVQDNPGEPLPEETFTHSHLLWSSIIPYLLHPSIHNLSPSFLWSTSWLTPSTSYSCTFLHPIIVFFSQHMPIPSQPVLL